jgi:membrane-bound ClpP family serine protease
MVVLGIILLIVFGIMLLLLEFFVVPGITIAGIVGFLLLGGGVFLAYDSYDALVGHFILAAVLIVVIITLVYAFRAKTWKKMSLNTKINSKVLDLQGKNIKPGDKGTSITRLAPMGKVLVNDITIEAKSIGPFIDENTEIEIIKVLNTNVVVKQINI